MMKFWVKYNGLSMSPLLKDQDVVLISALNKEDMKCGDILLFLDQTTKELTLHRLIDFPFQTKGDISLYAEMNPLDSCLGKAIGFKRGLFYRNLPSQNSIYNESYLCFSKLRMKGAIYRKLAHLFLLILTKLFEFCNEKTTLDHNEELLLTDL